MRSILLFIIATTLITCKQDQESYDWMVGEWERTNGKPGTQTLESWKKIDPETYTSEAMVLSGPDTLFVEHCTIKKIDNDYYYIAEVDHNDSPTHFKIIESKKGSFIAVNEAHDFPKKITYTINGNELNAAVSGDDKVIEYQFKRRV